MFQDTFIRWILTGLILFALSVSIYYRRKADVASKETVSRRGEGNFLLIALRVGGLIFWLSVIGYLIYPGILSWASVPFPGWLRWSGVAGAVLGAGLLFWMFRSLGRNITDTVATRENHSLVTHGPYRWIRHPLYTFATFFFLSFSVAAGNWFIGLMALTAMGLLALRTPIEEAKLIERFGRSYEDYQQKTGRFLPKLG
jgi:protein-S-isoprenylcysteine O-methyltransferase Ste14